MALAPTLRHADCCEILAAGLTPHQALWESWERSLTATTAFIDGDGCSHVGHGRLAVLRHRPAVASDSASRRARAAGFPGESVAPKSVMLLAICPVLVGIVDESYRKALRLLAALGYTVEGAVPVWAARRFVSALSDGAIDGHGSSDNCNRGNRSGGLRQMLPVQSKVLTRRSRRLPIRRR